MLITTMTTPAGGAGGIIIGFAPRTKRRGTIAYLALLIAALVIVAVGTSIWLMTDNNAGTNSLATDEKAMTRTPRLP